MKLGHKGHLNTKNKFSKEVLANSKISLSILDELKNLGLGERREMCEIEEARAMDSLQG
jgi:hypothetical protein